MKTKQVLFNVGISALTAVAVVAGYAAFVKNNNSYAGQENGIIPSNYRFAGLQGNGVPGAAVDFTQPSAAAIPTVVHIKTKTNAKQVTNNLPQSQFKSPFGDLFGDDLFEQFFGNRINVIPEQRASGSGVIISDDGYIVTNNHVVENADEITVTLNNKKTYKAKVVGADPAYDLAVIKIDGSGLPFLIYGNSDDVKIGQWVLAIGYPLNLETTVTAGIVSAKARSLGLNKSTKTNSAVESFIQTDAAVNMGNSGGALINTGGQLIGINSAIASPTGYYSGYSYAIPVNIVKKVVNDIIKYGTVQRAYIGISYAPEGISDEEKKANGIKEGNGVFVTGVAKNGAAEAAGVKKGDFITKLNGTPVATSAEMVEQVSRYKPGDKITLTYDREGRENTVTLTLKNNSGTYDVVTGSSSVSKLGADFATLDTKKAKEYGISGGVIVKKIKEGALSDQTRMRDGFIIIKVNDQDVNNIDQFNKAIGNAKSVVISGFYPGYDGLYDYPITLE